MLSERFGKIKKEYKLITGQNEQNNYLGKISIYVPFFMKSLWENPKSMATIISTADLEDIEENLAHFVVHYFYENYFSSNGREDQLLYIISLLLKEEINNLQGDETNPFLFLLDSPCKCIFEELIYKKDVISFFKTIVIEIIKTIEIKNSLDKISFDPKEISKIISKDKSLDKKLNSKIKLGILLNVNSLSLTLKDLEIKNSQCKDKDMKEYLKKKSYLYEKNPNLYSSDKFLDQIKKKKRI